jgi:hypothetical protein
MSIFKSLIGWGLFEYTEFFITPQRKKSGRERSRDLGGQMVAKMILPANMLSKSAIDISAVWATGEWSPRSHMCSSLREISPNNWVAADVIIFRVK